MAAAPKPKRRLMRQTELVDRVKAYDPDADENLLNKAYVYAMKAHGKQFRASGDPYFAHPLEVAAILTDLKLDVATIVTALLHDTIEDTLATYEDIRENFGDEIANLVDGVTKLSQLELFSERTKQAENFRKLMLAITSDIRVLLVKLADRLHNMRTLAFIAKPEKRRRIAQETQDIYAPLAGRIGMQNMREELEDLAFAELNPEERQSIVTRLNRLGETSGDRIGRIADQIKRKLAEHGMDAWVYGRAKRPFSIWRKLQSKQLNFEALSDIFGFRVIVRGEDDCYRALGVLHQTWQMVPDRFKDFISTPKTNGYRSIHTTVIGPEKQRVEVQIRTQEMHDVAERGVAAHWRYREHVASEGDDRAYEWLRDMVDLLEKDTAEDFLENSRLSMYQDQVFCFTPKGDLISLPRGATPIDFAYALHTDIGNTTVGAKVNGVHVPLHTPLRNGDQVEIIRTKEQTPSPLWEQFVVTGRARAEIRRFLRHAQRDEHVKFGRNILKKVFEDEGAELTDKAIVGVAKKLHQSKADDVYAEVGRGALRGHEVLEAVFPELKKDPERRRHAAFVEPKTKKPISIRGLTEGISYRLGQCCHPLPGDRIVGLMVPGEGITIHTIDCAELEKAQNMDDWLDVTWGSYAAEAGPSVARVLVRVKNAPGSLAAVMGVIAHNGGNIFNMKVTNRNPLYFEFTVDIEVRDLAHLQNILGALRVNAAVEAVDRVREKEEA
ncbi:MAG: bifunctional (p)ppGpp synthetase/guanosine-3',5'-bis(diphosphate) 3'-pyrophosphohydrolase [Rhizomicrobium sp.]